MTELELTVKENSFLASMNLSDSEEGKNYTMKYGCDPCDACGPSSCSDCNACASEGTKSGLNPFRRGSY